MTDICLKLTNAFKKNSDKLLFSAVKQLIKVKTTESNFEYQTGLSQEEWLNLISEETLSVGHFKVLIDSCGIGVAVDEEFVTERRDALESDYSDLSNKDIIGYHKDKMSTQYWAAFSVRFYLKNGAKSLVTDPKVINHFHEIKQTIVGHDDQLKQLLFHIHTNLQVIQHNRKANIQLPKRNMFIQGGTGTGKTFMIETVANHLGIPLASFNASELTQVGYTGKDGDDILDLLSANMGQPQILFLDEVDKLAVTNRDSGISTFGGQKVLLKLLEAQSLRSDLYNRNKGAPEEVDLSEVIIIMAGSFAQFTEAKAQEVKGSIGFGVADKVKKPTMPTIGEKELIEAGIIPEIAGRIGQVIALKPLGDDTLKEILLHSKQAIVKQFNILAEYNGSTFHLTDLEANEVVAESKKLNLGVRGLSTLTEKKFVDRQLKHLYN